jgi:hypothetical protein
MEDDSSYHFNKRVDKTYVSRRIDSPLEGSIRIASKVFDNDAGLMSVKERDHIVIRETPAQRHEVVAKFYEDSRRTFVLTIQKYNRVSGPSVREHFSFTGQEIPKLVKFLADIKRLHFPNDERINIPDDDLEKLLLSQAQAKRLVVENEDILVELAQSETLPRDIVALGYRRSQLVEFERLLSDPIHFSGQVSKVGKPERVWQDFFERNHWIFGYGLTYIFLDGLDGQKLEQMATGGDLANAGRRTDALLKTHAFISSLCFVEIKRHDTPLLSSSPYRSDVWSPSSEVSGGVAQMQATLQASIENLRRVVFPTDVEGNPTGEKLFNIMPRSFLVVGDLKEFITDVGVNEAKFRSFECYRRSILAPEIVTFDELFHRASFIVRDN